MKVLLQRDAFIDGYLYRRSDWPVDMPDELKDKLPKTAKIVETDLPKPKPAPQATLRDFDEVRRGSDAEQTIMNREAEKHKTKK